MKILDMHIHSRNTEITPEKLLSEMEKAGIYGGCVFSNHPVEALMEGGSSFEERLNETLSWCKGYEDRLFPVIWIHPYEDNIIEKVRIASKQGVCAFKIICHDFYVYEDKVLEVLKEIARLGKPVILHSGILWDGRASSEYNKPLNFEALINIEGLRFSMGHCSWPWIDECIALYGKFLNALNSRSTAEMFFDITPGTPEIYRKELLTKLYTIGYNVGDNVMFGTDSYSGDYSSAWAKKWLDTDRRILLDLGVSKKNIEKLYYGNLLRFLGKTDVEAEKSAPVTDDSKPWSALEPSVKETVKKWYSLLEFPSCFNGAFDQLLNTVPISDAITVENYPKGCDDGGRNLLSHLYLCEETAQRYAALGIPDDILIDTLKDVRTWTKTWSVVKGGLCLGELSWLERHFSCKLFKLGRLQFCMGKAETDIEKYGVKKGDNVLEIHIPEGDRLTSQECLSSINRAKEFFGKFFPQFKYTVFTCHSWLLDDTLKSYLPENSNIIKFGDMFEKISQDDSNALLRYLFRWDVNELNLKYASPASSLAVKVRDAVLKGEQFHETLGVIPV